MQCPVRIVEANPYACMYTSYMALLIAPVIALDSKGTVTEGTPHYMPKVSKTIT